MIDVGDYQMRGRDDELVLVTRKSSDLFASVYDGHFTDEIQKCLNLLHSSGGGKLVFIYEGPWALTPGGVGFYKKAGPEYFRRSQVTGAGPQTLPNIQLKLQSAGAIMVCTTSIQETADALVAVYHNAQDGWPAGFTKGLPKPELRWSSDRRVARLMALWPHLREETAQLLLERFGCIMEVVRVAKMEPDSLLEIPGLGKKGVANFKEVIT